MLAWIKSWFGTPVPAPAEVREPAANVVVIELPVPQEEEGPSTSEEFSDEEQWSNDIGAHAKYAISSHIRTALDQLRLLWPVKILQLLIRTSWSSLPKFVTLKAITQSLLSKKCHYVNKEPGSQLEIDLKHLLNVSLKRQRESTYYPSSRGEEHLAQINKRLLLINPKHKYKQQSWGSDNSNNNWGSNDGNNWGSNYSNNWGPDWGTQTEAEKLAWQKIREGGEMLEKLRQEKEKAKENHSATASSSAGKK